MLNYDEERVRVEVDGEFAADGVLSDHSHPTWRRVRVGPRVERVPGPEVIDLKIRFLEFASTDLQNAANAFAERKRAQPPLVDLVFEGGARLRDCQISGYFGGRLGERWYGVSPGERVEAEQVT